MGTHKQEGSPQPPFRFTETKKSTTTMSAPTAAGPTRDPAAALAFLWRFAEASHGHEINGEGDFAFKGDILKNLSVEHVGNEAVLLKKGKRLTGDEVSTLFRGLTYVTCLDDVLLSTAWWSDQMVGREAHFVNPVVSHPTVSELLNSIGLSDGLTVLREAIAKIGVKHSLDISMLVQFVARGALLVVMYDSAHVPFDAARFVEAICEGCPPTYPMYNERSALSSFVLRLADPFIRTGRAHPAVQLDARRGVPRQSLSSSPPRRHEPWSPPSPRRREPWSSLQDDDHFGPRQADHVSPYPYLFASQSNTAVGTSPPTTTTPIAPRHAPAQATAGPSKPSTTDLARQDSAQSVVGGMGGAPSAATGASGKTQCRTELIDNYDDSSDTDERGEGSAPPVTRHGVLGERPTNVPMMMSGGGLGAAGIFGYGGKSDPIFDHVEQATERAIAAQDEAAARLREETQKLQNEAAATIQAMQEGAEQAEKERKQALQAQRQKRLEEEQEKQKQLEEEQEAREKRQKALACARAISRAITRAVHELKQKYVLEWHNSAEDARLAGHHDTETRPTEAQIAAAKAVRDENEATRKATVSLPYDQELPDTRLKDLFDSQLAHLLDNLLSHIHHFAPDDMLRVHHVFAVPVLTWFQAHMEPAHFATIFPEGGSIPITCVNDMTEVFKKIMARKKFNNKRVAAARDLYNHLAKHGEGIFRGDAKTLEKEGTQANTLETVFVGLLLAMGTIPAVATKTDMIFPVYRIAVILLRAVQRLSHERKVDANHQCVPWLEGIKIKAPGGAGIDAKISSLLRETCPNCC